MTNEAISLVNSQGAQVLICVLIDYNTTFNTLICHIIIIILP